MSPLDDHAATRLADVDDAAASLAARLPDPLAPFARLATNWWWCWQHDVPGLFERVDPARWHEVRHNPVRMLLGASARTLARAAGDAELVAAAAAAADRLAADLDRPARPGVDPAHPVAFLCAEFGVHEALSLYSGGLGVLAGDIVKEASDLALPMVAVGLFYRLGYFRQRLDRTGWQHESWDVVDTATTPVVPVSDGDDGQLQLHVGVRGHDVAVRVWRAQVGRVPLYLLDTDVPTNPVKHRWTTARLYDGTPEVRLAQYTVLGTGAVRLFEHLDLSPGTVHMNEGHPATAALELVAGEVAAGRSFDDAAARVRDRCVFTTHTPVPAGNETYPPQTLLAAMPDLAGRLGLDTESLLDLGRVHPDPHAPAGMTPVALRLARSTNGVSQRHGEVAREMWQPLFGGRVDDVPITHVTNGVHLPTWMGRHVWALLDRHLPADWWRRVDEPGLWEQLDRVPDAELWAARTASRADLVDWARERSTLDRLRRGTPIEWADVVLDPDALTLGFARRVASYKRLHLLTRDVERIVRLLGGEHHVQVLIAGKAHPRDDGAKAMVRDMFATGGIREVAERVVFLEDYDMEVGRRLTTGCDVWLNVPRPPMEASGTSGMKVVLNGGLNLSVLDGWWAEGFDGHNGWAIDGTVDHDHGRQDHQHAQALLDLVEHQVLPTFHDRGADGVPTRWVAMMRRSLQTLVPRFAATRMMREYADLVY